MSLVLNSLLVVACFFHFVSGQHCSLPLQCSGAGDNVDHGTSSNPGMPGKRGPKGEKGDSYGENTELMERLALLENRLNITEAELEVEKAKVEVLEDQIENIGNCNTPTPMEPEQPTSLALVTGGILKLRSCKDVSTILNVKINGTYKIQPKNSLPPFNVYCGFIGEAVLTSIEHDSEGEIKVENCEAKRCYGRPINYDATVAQIRAMMQISGQCRQFIKYRCIGSILLNEKNGNVGYAGWENWNGELRRYWGGAEGRLGYCACGITGTCVTCAQRCGKCNCDINTGEHEDLGYLTQQHDLPITKLYFGDTGDSGENGFHTLGRLQCFA